MEKPFLRPPWNQVLRPLAPENPGSASSMTFRAVEFVSMDFQNIVRYERESIFGEQIYLDTLLKLSRKRGKFV